MTTQFELSNVITTQNNNIWQYNSSMLKLVIIKQDERHDTIQSVKFEP